MILWPDTPVVTPLGPATLFAAADGSRPKWACWIDSTQELFFFDNIHVRRRPTVTDPYMRISPFCHLNRKINEQIARYIQNGWLPADYDPEKVETWKI